ncbi:pimeloyl-ACP methyl ester carboxylesterase [Rhizobium sp. ERR 922]|uniref:alpha/beta fold hydrolase n=1 Tax=unclassified Rhizobium TaxID=2613769 RepID=UPI0011A1436D|nr:MULTISPECIES: alpha/beta hydrolase [unclassified Rhizobium]TWB53132.1 pimeloyl-ACP methyl ester carboxylesterase [Rhizobium sp. ERR 922]TWB95903.1 pimeloyl-ACP methyl ester carboxylesterase [Rhizobium sp. ERR 942]
MTVSLETASTKYLEAGGIRFAYRRLGPDAGTPLILLQHFTGTMDSWDPAVVNALAVDRPIIVFDNAGVGASSGIVPDNVEQQSTDAESFIASLGFGEVDLLGFSLGGFLAQIMASRSRIKVRKMIIAGSAPRGGEEHLLEVVEEAFAKNARDVRLPLFFTLSKESQKAGEAFVDRALARTNDRDPDSGEDVSEPQAKSIIAWCAEQDEDHALLKAIKQPTLIVHGSDDTMFPSINAYEMFKAMINATLILYPDSGHGALFQYPHTFVAHVKTFLDA